jgi:hypothetical protein
MYNYKQYLYLFLIILVFSQPELINYLYSNVLGKALLVGGVVLLATINQLAGFVFLFIILGALASSSFSMEHMSLLSHSDYVASDIKEPDGPDREHAEVLVQRKKNDDNYDFAPIQLYEPVACDPITKTGYSHL